MSLFDGLKKISQVAQTVQTVASRIQQGAEKGAALADLIRERKESGLCPACGKACDTPPQAQGLCSACLGKLTAGVLENADLLREVLGNR